MSGMEFNIYSVGFFFPIYTSNQNSVCTKGCLKPVGGIIFFFTFSKIGCRCYEVFSHVFTPSEVFFDIPRVS